MFGSARITNISGPNFTLPAADVVGDAVGTSADVAKFGSRSYKAWNGTGNSSTYIKVTPSPNLLYVVPINNFRVPEFTAEFWYYMTANPTTTVAMWQRLQFSTEWRFLMQANGIPQLRYRYYNPYPGTLTERVISGTTGNGTALNTWHHLAFTTQQNTTRFFQNGILVATFTEAEGFAESGDTSVGWAIGEGAASGMRYYIDEVRVSNVCRYTATFTPQHNQFQYDNRTVALLHFEETAGSKNFVSDLGAKRAPKQITALGNAQVSTAQSKFGGASLRTDGVDDCLKIRGINLVNNWTCEGWFYISSTVSEVVLFRIHNSSDSFQANYGLLNNRMYIFESGTSQAATTLATGVWHHLAWVKNASGVSMYLNGVLDGSRPSSMNLSNAVLYISGIGSGSNSLNGYSDEIRISDNVRYSANFTAPTAPFVNDGNTQLLIHADGTNASTYFEDDNGVVQIIETNNNAVIFGNPSISTAQSKFNGSSLYLDGSSSLTFNQNNININGSSDNFTIEGWFYRVSGTTNGSIINFSNSNYPRWAFFWRSTGKFGVYNSTSGTFLESTTTLNLNTWYHFAVVKQGTSITLYLNGQSVGSTTNSINIVCDFLEIGAYNTSGQTFNGYIDEVRISNTARYTANFTVPSAEFTGDSNTLALLHFNGNNGDTSFTIEPNLTFSKYRYKSSGISQGSAQVSTTLSKFGSSSLALNGSTDWVNVYGADYGFYGEDNFTLECWFYKTSGLTSNGTLVNIAPIGDPRWAFFTRSNSKVALYNQVTNLTFLEGSTLISLNTWYHVAYVKTGNTWKIYLNGILDGTATNTVSLRGGLCQIGAFGTGSDKFPGYIDELRISNTARYTANFTPSTTPFQNDANTLLLLHMDGTNASTVFLDDNG